MKLRLGRAEQHNPYRREGEGGRETCHNLIHEIRRNKIGLFILMVKRSSFFSWLEDVQGGYREDVTFREYLVAVALAQQQHIVSCVFLLEHMFMVHFRSIRIYKQLFAYNSLQL